MNWNESKCILHLFQLFFCWHFYFYIKWHKKAEHSNTTASVSELWLQDNIQMKTELLVPLWKYIHTKMLDVLFNARFFFYLLFPISNFSVQLCLIFGLLFKDTFNTLTVSRHCKNVRSKSDWPMRTAAKQLIPEAKMKIKTCSQITNWIKEVFVTWTFYIL